MKTDLIGPAAKVGKILDGLVPKLKATDGTGSARGFLLYGPPGVGKTRLSSRFSLAMAGDPLAIDERSGLNVTIDVVRDWLGRLGMGNLFGDWQVRMIEELDRVPRDAQDLLLHYLDKLPPKTLFIGTSNLQIDLLQERFQSRLRTWKIMPPDTAELTAFLQRERNVSATAAGRIAVGSGGNVRMALLDADNELDAREFLAA